MAEPDNTALSPHYYRDNFLRLCDTVEAQYADILTSTERALLQRFRELDSSAQCLYVRMISRTGPWFRESKLNYSELGPQAPVLATLLDQDMALEAVTLSARDLGKLFTRDELRQIFPDLTHRQFQDKAALLDAIDQLQLEPEETLQALQVVDTQRIVAPRGAELAQYLQLLFFGNRRQGLTDFVLQDIGITRYYPYPLDRAHRLFPCREAVDEYLACAALRDNHRELRDAGAWDALPALAAAALAMTIRFPSTVRSWHKLCNSLALDLERQGAWDSALLLYSCSSRHPARERRARILERRGDWVGVLVLCEEILSHPWCEAEREAAGRILPRVKRKLDGSRVPRRRDIFSTKTLALPRGHGPVEQQVAAHLQSQWQAVYYVENKLMNALFGLAFWEQIFAAIPGVFHNPYQSAPADMYSCAFSEARRGAIADRLAQLREADLATILGESFRKHQNYQCSWIDWRRIDAQLIDTSTRAIPASHLLAIWERMLFDPGENRRGFPDLIALGAAPGDYCLIEVKAPGDALQESQKLWLRFFQAHRIPAQVAWVEWRND